MLFNNETWIQGFPEFNLNSDILFDYKDRMLNHELQYLKYTEHMQIFVNNLTQIESTNIIYNVVYITIIIHFNNVNNFYYNLKICNELYSIKCPDHMNISKYKDSALESDFKGHNTSNYTFKKGSKCALVAHIFIHTYQLKISQITLSNLKHCLPYEQSFTLHSTPKCFILFQNTQELPLILNLTYLTWKIITKFVLKLHTIHYIVPIILVHRFLSLDLNMNFIKYLYFVGTKSSYRGIIPILSDTSLKMGLISDTIDMYTK